MAVVGYATIQLIPSMQGFTAATQKQLGPAATSAGAKAGKSSGGAFSGGFIGAVGKIAAAAGIYSAISGIASGFSNAIKTGLQGNANLQAYSISFETLLGSASKAKDMIASLYDFAAKTPFDVEGSVVGAQKLLGVGVAAKDVIPTLTTLGDAVGALGGGTEQFNAVLLAYSQIMARGKVSTQDLYQISNTGIPIFQLMSKALGKPVGEIQKLIETGNLASKDVLPQLLSQMNKDYGGAMSKQATTLGGLWSTFKDTITQSLTTATGGLAAFAQSALPGFTTAVSGTILGIGKAFGALPGIFSAIANTPFAKNLIGSFQQIGAALMPILSTVGTALSSAFQGAVSQLGPVFSQLTPLLFPLSTFLKQLIPLIQPVASALGGVLVTAVNLLVGVLVQLAPIGAQVGSFMSQLGGTLVSSLLPVISSLTPLLGTVAAAFGSLVQGVLPPLISMFQSIASAILPPLLLVFSTLATTVLPIFMSLIQALVPIFTSLIAAIVPFVSTLVSTLAPVITQLITTLLPPLMALFQAVVPILQALIPPIIQIVSTIAGALLPIFQAIMPVVTTVIGAIVPIIQSLATIIAGVVNVVAGLLSGNWSQVWQGAGQVVSGIWGVIKGVVVGGAQIIGAAVVAALNIIRTIWNTVWSVVGTVVSAAWNTVISVLNNGISAVTGVFNNIVSTINGFARTFGTLLIDSGKALIKGFVDGIKGAIGMVKDAVGSVVQAARDFFPFSPAKTGPFSGKGYTTYSGRALVDGFSKGIGDRKRSLQKVMDNTLVSPSIDPVDGGGLTGNGVRGAVSDLALATAGNSSKYIGAVNLNTTNTNAGVVDELNFFLRNLDRGGR